MSLQPTNKRLPEKGLRKTDDLRADLVRLLSVRVGVLFASLLLAWVLASQLGRVVVEGLGMESPSLDWGAVALQTAMLCFVCFAGAAIANLVGQRTGQPVGAAMITVSLRTGGVAVGVLVIWLAFDRAHAKVELAVLAFMYCIALIADTVAWLIEIRLMYDSPRVAPKTEVHSSAENG